MNSKTGAVVGPLTVAIGMAHTTLGLVRARRGGAGVQRRSGERPLIVHQSSERGRQRVGAETFWFTAFGLLVIADGIGIWEAERARGFPPPSVLAATGAVMTVGVISRPASGFWSLLLPIGAGAWSWLRHGRPEADRAD